MASVRSLDNALETNWAIAPAVDMQKITKDDGSTIIPDNGRILRNLIHGADTVMSHITHFYHLAALDYVETDLLNSAPFTPQQNPTSAPGLLPPTTVMPNGMFVVSNYVEALTMRRYAHSMGAIFSGRQPTSNAIVAGGVSTLPTASDVDNFSALLNTIRTFINTAYIPDVVSVATLGPGLYSGYWLAGTQPGHLLSYGEYPIQTGTNAERLLIARALINVSTLGITLQGAGDPTNFLSNVTEDVAYSYYSSPSGLKPSAGKTEPDVAKVGMAPYYSWLKAPRFFDGTSDVVCEVGPMARMVAAYRDAGVGTLNDPVVSELNSTKRLYAGALAGGASQTYTLSGLVGAALSVVNTALTTGPVGPSVLVSILGRHACRALECKYVADAMADTGLAQPQQAWLSELKANDLTSPVYVYAKLPNQPKSGAGWAEAPRGALGHWISIEKKRITNYQCVVPSTWNHSPRDDSNRPGACEQVIEGLGSVAGYSLDDITLTLQRVLHTYDFCIACAVHVVKPDGSTIAKFKMETDGRVTKLPVDAEI